MYEIMNYEIKNPITFFIVWWKLQTQLHLFPHNSEYLTIHSYLNLELQKKKETIMKQKYAISFFIVWRKHKTHL